MENKKYLIESEASSPLWRIKYRLKTLEAIKLYYRPIYAQFKGYIASNNIPHLMLVGPSGSGKTMLAEILSRELLKAEFQLNYKFLFADDPISKQDRKDSQKAGRVSTKRIGSSAGAQRRYRPFIQIKVRPFVSAKKFGDAPFKILLIKNFHQLDVEQQAFRRIMEQYSRNCRMILITDRVSGIIDPIISRCQLIMVPQVKKPFFIKFLKTVCDEEKIPVNLDILNYVHYMSKANIGKALDLLQLTKLRFNFITLDNLAQMQSEISDKSIQSLFTKILNGNFSLIRKSLRDIFYKSKLSKNEILLQLSRVITQLPLERDVKAFYLDLIAETDFESLDSSDDEIQLNCLFAKMALVGKMG